MRERAQLSAATGFTTTMWSDIRAVRTATPERQNAVLNNLVLRYWQPVFQYLRARGHQPEAARDLTQDFFVEVVLGHDLFGRAEPERGRFRAYLLHCLKTYTREQYRRRQARCRAGTLSLSPWDESKIPTRQPAAELTPDEVFHQQWAAALLARVVERLKGECARDALSAHFVIFEERCIRPSLDGTHATPVEELAERFSLTTKQVCNRSETIRRRFRKLLLEEVRLTIEEPATAEEELDALLAQLRS